MNIKETTIDEIKNKLSKTGFVFIHPKKSEDSSIEALVQAMKNNQVCSEDPDVYTMFDDNKNHTFFMFDKGFDGPRVLALSNVMKQLTGADILSLHEYKKYKKL